MKPMDITLIMEAAGKLKETKRTGWVESGIPSPESVAEHSYRTALLAMVLADINGIDALKAVRMALIHDLAEARVGDLTPRQKQGNHSELETTAMKEILSELPGEVREYYLNAWLEYQRNTSPEARLVHNADKIEMLFQSKDYEKTGVDLDQFWETELNHEYEKYRPKRV